MNRSPLVVSLSAWEFFVVTSAAANVRAELLDQEPFLRKGATGVTPVARPERPDARNERVRVIELQLNNSHRWAYDNTEGQLQVRACDCYVGIASHETMHSPIGNVVIDRVPQSHEGRIKFLGRIVDQDGHELFHGRTHDSRLEARKDCKNAARGQSIHLSGMR